MNINNSFFLSFLSLLIAIGFSQLSISQNTIVFDRISTNEGLSQGDVNIIYQDNKGFMWFGTHDGLNKYNGYEFTVYKPNANDSTSINSNLIYAITGDNEGNLWVGTTGNGLNYYNKTTGNFKHYLHNKEDIYSLSSNHINTLYIDARNMLWIGTANGLDLVDLKKTKNIVKFKHYNPVHNKITTNFLKNNVYAIFEDSKNQLWVGSSNGLFKLSRDENGTIYFISLNNLIDLPNDTSVQSIAEDEYGRLIIGTGKGLYIYNSAFINNKVIKIKNGFYSDIKIDNKNNIWAGSNMGLLYFLNQDLEKTPILENQFTYDPKISNSISKNIIKSLFIDKTGILWIGTNGGGINKLDPEQKKFKLIKKTLDPKSLSYDKIRSIFEDSNNNLWIGTEGGGLNILTSKNNDGNYANFINLKTVLKPFAIEELASKKTILIGAENTPGLYEINISDINKIKESDLKPIKEVPFSVFSILEDSNENVWIGTYSGGIYRWLKNKNSGGYKKDVIFYTSSNTKGIPSNIIRNIYEDSNHNIWFGTGDGLSKLIPSEISKENPAFITFKNNPKNKNSISHNYILALYENKKGDFWIGTLGGGLNKLVFNKNESEAIFKTYTETDGLANNVVKGILEDSENNLWLSTNKGLSKFNPKDETFKNYDVNDGLQDNEFQELAFLKRKNGEMIFGGINGFNAFYPEKIEDNPYKANAVVTNFFISNKEVSQGEKINGRVILKRAIDETKSLELEYFENSFSFEFAALHYSAPSKNRFAYKLEGFDEDWIYTNSNKRFATYTNLEFGKYVLKVKASNNDGIWEDSSTEITIDIIPPIWKTRGAYIFYTILFLGMISFLWINTIAKAKHKHQSELASLKNQKEEELQNLKLKFFTNISHELRTPLTLIKGPLEYLIKKGTKIKQDTAQEQYELMKKNTDYLFRLVNQLLDFRKINQGKMHLVMRHTDIVSFIKEVAEPFQFLSHKQQIKLTVHGSKPFITTWFDHEALEKIINNLLSNAFKFTPKNGKIDINISKETAIVTIEVKDSGIGIPDSSRETIFERFYSKKTQDNSNTEGVGIGLSFVKNLIELHQGTISVSSETGQGTSFVVKIPSERKAYENIPEISCKESTDADFKRRTSENESFAIDLDDEITDEKISKERSKSPVLLIVDDNRDIRIFIKQVLQEEYTIYEAENGQQGLEIAKKIIPNIVITDLMMPIMNGLQFCENLKTTKTTSHIPVIILTAKLSQESELKGLQHGADDYIRKPFDVELLHLKLKNILQQREQLRIRFNREITLQPKEVTVTSSDERFLQQAIEIVEKHMMNTDFSVEMLVKEMGHSRSNLYLKFKEITGLSSSEFIRNIRLKRAVQLFESSDLSVKEIMYMTGFNTASYFAKCFKKQFGVKPSDYVRKFKKKV
ncbi:two-component regulator propeller domain-containing protein [uncultured Polaribacter sp.]|uniref:hybrid sensor histidine kinase/response regulator transcription factor n=1 Tax=uncultured Polaribacter sp. TaxID=174711 RepID=UPI00261F9371|nr:two-component regulator propeller domain-containing protein [uncultured Polaribacter sp.]